MVHNLLSILKYTYNISLRRISFFSEIRSPRSVTPFLCTKTPTPPAPQKIAPAAQPLSACRVIKKY